MNDDQVQSINNSLKIVGTDLRNYASRTDAGIAEVRARLQAVEQHVANIEPGAPIGGFAGPGLVAAVLAEIDQGDSAFDALQRGNRGSARFSPTCSLRAALVGDGSSSGSYPSYPDRKRIVEEALAPLTIFEAFPHETTDRDTVEAVVLHSSGDAAEQALEGDLKAELTTEGELRSFPVGTFAGHETASVQVLADHQRLGSAMDRVLRGKTLRAFEKAIVLGGSDSSNTSRVTGLLESSTPFVPVIGGNVPDTIGEAIVAQRKAGYQPSIIIMSPLRWHMISTAKTEGPEEFYRYGNPAQPVAPSLWGLPVVQTSWLDDDVVLVVDTTRVSIIDRQAPSVEVSRHHSDNFVKNLATILAELRGTLAVYDQWAIYRVDIGSGV